MALVVNVLEIALKGIFITMQSGLKNDEWMAAQTAAAIKAFILAGQVVTVDVGAAPTGVYTGAGIGTMIIDVGGLKDSFQKTFEAGYDCNDLASAIAQDIDTACSADNIVTIISTGAATTPVGAPVPFSGPGAGSFTGAKVSIEKTLKACFAVMNGMAAGGDAFFAAQLALAVFAYLQAGVISVTLNAPFVSGTGIGGLL